MKLTIINGTAKKGINNTEVLLKKFDEGFKQYHGNESEIYRLNYLKSKEEAVDLFRRSECIVLAFPLYVYSMPADVKEFIELLEPFCGMCSDKKIGFIVQYGFPEDIHARPLEEYLERFTKLLNGQYLGTIIKGGCDNLAASHESNSKEILDGIHEIGKIFGETGKFDKELLERYAKSKIQNSSTKKSAKNFIEFINESYWGAKLKRNGVYDQSYARPYVN